VSWSVEIAGEIASFTYSNPPENRLPFVALARLEEELRAIAADEQVKLVVLKSGVADCFSLGADLRDIGALVRGEPPSAPFGSWAKALLALENLPQPTIAYIHGPAASGGCELSLACTFRVGTSSAQFTFRELARGAIPGAGATQRLPRLVGMARAAEIIMTARSVDAEEALHIGLLQALLPPGTAALDSWLSKLTAMPRAGLVAAKRAMTEGSGLPLSKGLRLEQRLFLELVSAK
jgi:enoyl-CoA hydratase/carnithine racemase